MVLKLIVKLDPESSVKYEALLDYIADVDGLDILDWEQFDTEDDVV